MTWYEFKKAYRFRTADKCCENCKHGDVRFEGECRCEHPLLQGEFLTGDVISCVCDLWETDGEAEEEPKACDLCVHYRGAHPQEIDHDTGETIVVVSCECFAVATPDCAETCVLYQRRTAPTAPADPNPANT